MNPNENDLIEIDPLETLPARTLADLFPASHYAEAGQMPAGAVGSLQRGPGGCFAGLGDCACAGQIGPVGYREVAGGPVLCWGCYVQAMRRAK